MAGQSGPFFIEGTIDNVTFYKMDGVYYVRKKSSLSRKKVLKSPRFERTRQHAYQLAQASKIASVIYKQLPKEKRSLQLFRAIVGKAKQLLAKGKTREVTLNKLIDLYSKPINAEDQIRNDHPASPFIKSKSMAVNQAGRLIIKPGHFKFLNRIQNHHSSIVNDQW